MTRQNVDIESLEAFDAFVARRTTMRGVTIQSVDLSERNTELAQLEVRGGLFLGCALTDEAEDDLRARGALVFPEIPALPFDPYRAKTYTADELFDAATYPKSRDARIYAWSQHQHTAATMAGSIAVALHDHSMSDALAEALEATQPRMRVGVMGGHGVLRGTDAYTDAALLGFNLARAGYTVFTGGGPGAMEAANLGAHFAPYDRADLALAIEILAEAPSFAADIDEWARAATEVRKRWPATGDAVRSVGIPTWFYGHEPPNQFADVIAKFFANPLREATLLERCQGGIVYLAGAAGTVSEIFMDACENYYAASDNVAPMILVDVEQWTTTLPAWPLLTALAGTREMAGAIHLVSSTADAVKTLTGSEPE